MLEIVRRSSARSTFDRRRQKKGGFLHARRARHHPLQQGVFRARESSSWEELHLPPQLNQLYVTGGSPGSLFRLELGVSGLEIRLKKQQNKGI